MATRFWLTSSAPPYTPTTKRGAWDVASGEDVQLLGRQPAGSAGTSSINVGSTAADRDVLLHRSISAGAVKAGTVSGTVTWVIGAKESNAALNGFFHLHIYVTSGDSDTPRGTLLTDSIGATEFGTTAIGAGEGAKAVSSVAVSVGDRIVVEIGYRANASSTTQNATINYGNTGTADLSISSSSVTSQPGWIEFSGADGLWTKSLSTLTDAFPSTIDSKWTASSGVAVVSGRARIDCTTATPNMRTSSPYEITASTAAFKVPVVPATGGGSTVAFSAYLMSGPTANNTNLEFEYSPNSGNLVLRNNVSGSDASPTTLTYSGTDHLWWRFKESGGSILMETSPDNSTWTTRRTISSLSQWMLQGNHILYFEATRASGTADFAEIDDINPSGTVQAVTLASSTETAQSLAKTKTLAVTVASASEAAQPVGRTKRLTLNIATETDTSQAVGHTRQRATTTATATETAQPLGKTKTAPLTLATETGAAQPLTKVRGATLGIAADTSTAQTITPAKTKALGVATGTETAQALTAAKRAPAGPATATDQATTLGRTKTAALTPAAETSTAQTLTPTRTRTLGTASSTDTSQAITAVKAATVGTPTETGTARPITPAKALTLGVATEQAAAQTLGGSSSHTATPAEETSTAQPIGKAKTSPLTPAAEQGAARTATPTKRAAAGPAAAVDAAQPLHAAKILALGTAQETGTAQTIASGQAHPVDQAAAVDAAQTIRPSKTRPLGPAFDYSTAGPAGRAKTASLGPATETETSNGITATTPRALPVATATDIAHPIRAVKTRTLGTATSAENALTIERQTSQEPIGPVTAGKARAGRWSAHHHPPPWAARPAINRWTARR